MSNWRSFVTVPIPELITFMMTCHANTEGVGIKHAWLQMCSMHPLNFILNSNLKYAIIQGHLQSCQPFHHRWRSTRTGPSWPSPQSSSPLESTTAWCGWTIRWNRRSSRYCIQTVQFLSRSWRKKKVVWVLVRCQTIDTILQKQAGRC